MISIPWDSGSLIRFQDHMVLAWVISWIDVVEAFKQEEEEDYDDEVIKFSLIGVRTSVNHPSSTPFLETDRVIVSMLPERPGMQSIPLISYDGQDYVIIDTAGMRKKGKVYETTEKYSVLRA